MNKHTNCRIPLAEGTMLTEKLEILKLLSDVGGSSLTYLARYTNSTAKVVVKEFFPLISSVSFQRKDNLIICDSDDERKIEVALATASARFNQEFENAQLMYQSGESNSIYHMSYTDITDELTQDFNGTIAKYFVIETKDGRTLDEIIAKENVAIKDALLYTKKILLALQDTHKKGFLHLDIKPGNLFFPSQLDIEETFCIFLDYGSAMKIGGDLSFNLLSLSTGFAAKELKLLSQFSAGITANKYAAQKAKSLLNKGSDCFSVGCVLFKMMLGDLFDYNVLNKIVEKEDITEKIKLIYFELSQRSDENQYINQTIAEIIAKSLYFSADKEKMDEKRYSDCQEFLDDISEAIDTLNEVGVKDKIIDKKAFDIFNNQCNKFNLHKKLDKDWSPLIKQL